MGFPLLLALIIAPIVALVVFAALIALMPHGTAKGRLDEGRVTYARADYDAALNKFMPLAKAYNAHTPSMLDILCRRGQGVEKNFLFMAKLYKLAATFSETLPQCLLLGGFRRYA